MRALSRNLLIGFASPLRCCDCKNSSDGLADHLDPVHFAGLAANLLSDTKGHQLGPKILFHLIQLFFALRQHEIRQATSASELRKLSM